MSRKKHWNKKLQKPFTDGRIPNHPDMRMNTFTQTIEIDWKNAFVKLDTGDVAKSLMFGAPVVKNVAWTISTSNIAKIRNNSILDCLGPVVIDEISVL